MHEGRRGGISEEEEEEEEGEHACLPLSLSPPFPLPPPPSLTNPDAAVVRWQLVIVLQNHQDIPPGEVG